jgi:hypothetical protein
MTDFRHMLQRRERLMSNPTRRSQSELDILNDTLRRITASPEALSDDTILDAMSDQLDRVRRNDEVLKECYHQLSERSDNELFDILNGLLEVTGNHGNSSNSNYVAALEARVAYLEGLFTRLPNTQIEWCRILMQGVEDLLYNNRLLERELQ